MASKEVDRQLLLTYLEGSCTPEQLRQIKEYLRDEAYRDSLNQFMQEEWEALSRSELLPLPGMEDQYARFRSAYIAPIRRRSLLRVIRMAAVAAAVLLLVAGVWLLYPRLNGRQDHGTAQWLFWQDEPGHCREIVLPDSTRIYLGSASTLRYQQGDNHSRLVQLEGEAYFVIRHDQHRPFTVVTGALTTMDIGTEFNIRYYPGEPSIEVAVADGKVRVLQSGEKEHPLASLAPGQVLHYDSLTKQAAITSLPDASLIGAWRKGILTFRHQPLIEVTGELGRYYGVRFQYADHAATHILITTLLDNKTLEDALDIVSLTAGVHFIRQGNTIVVK
jgi:transmembrane sensor